MNRLNELLYGDLNSLMYHLDVGNLDLSELNAALLNVVQRLEQLERAKDRGE